MQPADLPDPNPIVVKITGAPAVGAGPKGAQAAPPNPWGIVPSDSETRMFKGFFGDTREINGIWWTAFYLDLDHRTWFIVRTDDITACDTQDDEKVPGGRQDYIWVRREGLLGPCGPRTNPADLILTGRIISVERYATSVRGDTYSPSSGLPLCGGGCGSNTGHH